MSQTIGDRLQDERKRLGYSQEAFAALAGITRVPYREWEKGHTSPTVAHLMGLAAAGADVLYIITGRRDGAALTPEEAALLEHYRRAPKDGQRAIRAAAAAFKDEGEGEV